MTTCLVVLLTICLAVVSGLGVTMTFMLDFQLANVIKGGGILLLLVINLIVFMFFGTPVETEEQRT